MNRFGSPGQQAGQISGASAMAFGMSFNDRNELLVASRNKVFKFAINQ